MTLTLTDLRKQRDAREYEELQARIAEMRQKLVPLLVQDLRSELDEQSGKDLLELVDHFGLSDAEYDQVRVAALSLAKDHAKLEQLRPDVRRESLWLAELVVARRRAEQAANEAKASSHRERQKRNQVQGFAQEIARCRDDFPFLFDGERNALPAITELPVEVPEKKEESKKQCVICLSLFPESRKSDYCSGRCEHIARTHREALAELGVLKPKRRSRNNG